MLSTPPLTPNQVSLFPTSPVPLPWFKAPGHQLGPYFLFLTRTAQVSLLNLFSPDSLLSVI